MILQLAVNVLTKLCTHKNHAAQEILYVAQINKSATFIFSFMILGCVDFKKTIITLHTLVFVIYFGFHYFPMRTLNYTS